MASTSGKFLNYLIEYRERQDGTSLEIYCGLGALRDAVSRWAERILNSILAVIAIRLQLSGCV